MNATISPPAHREGVRGSADGSGLPDGIHRFEGGRITLVGFDAISAFADGCDGCPDCSPRRTVRDTSELRV